MSFGSSFPRRVTEYEFDGENRLVDVRQITKADGSIETEHIWALKRNPCRLRSSTANCSGFSS